MSSLASNKDLSSPINWDQARSTSVSYLGLGMLQMVDSLPFYVLLIDANHRILLANKATRETLGLQPHEIVGGYCPAVVHGIEDGRYPGCPLEEAVEQNRGIEREHYDEESDRWLKIAIYPTGMRTPEDREVFFHMIQDITEQKEAIEKLRRSEEKYVKSFVLEHNINEILQSALLPKTPKRDDVEVGLYYRSMGDFAKVGGDFYDFIDLGDHRLAIAVGDVSGKGLEAANLVSMLKYTLRAYLAEGLSLNACLSRLNRLMYEEMPEEKFITLGVALIDTAEKTISYISAGHPLPVLSKDCLVSRADVPQGLPLGVEKEHEYDITKISDAKHCYFLMYSDGLIEAGSRSGRPFGRKRFIEYLEDRELSNSQKAADDLLDEAVRYSGGNLNDDVSLIVVKIL